MQFGRGYYRPPIVGRYYAPIYPYGYTGYYNPYWQYHSERYYDWQSLNYAKNRLRNDEDKYYADGYLTDKEQRRLDSDRYKVARDRNRLRDDW